MRKLFFIILFICCPVSFLAKSQSDNKTIQLLKESNFFLLNEIINDPDMVKILNNSTGLNAFKTSKTANLNKTKNALIPLEELINTYIFSAADIKTTTDELVKLYNTDKKVKTFFTKIRLSEKYRNFNQLSDQEFIMKTWELCINGLNHTLGVYGLGQKPIYPDIDSISYDVTSTYFHRSAYFWSNQVLENTTKNSVFFESTLNYSLSLMYMNHRDEAIRYEPLDQSINAKAIELAKTINFSEYDYNALIVLGDGPENYTDPLGALGKLNLNLAVTQFKQGKAPFIIVSGGHVHPNRTKTCEAIEMKKELINIYAIPEENIIVEPYARHTTTNLRNATRLMLRYGFDIKQKSLIITHYYHSTYISNENFEKRYINELGYSAGTITPLTLGGPLEYIPNKTSTHQNPLEPLDP